MKPVDFVQSNSTLTAGDIPNCSNLPVYKNETEIISKWTMSWRERLSALFFGVAWLTVLSPITSPPVSVWVIRERFE